MGFECITALMPLPVCWYGFRSEAKLAGFYLPLRLMSVIIYLQSIYLKVVRA